jgi:hypothetical protein
MATRSRSLCLTASVSDGLTRARTVNSTIGAARSDTSITFEMCPVGLFCLSTRGSSCRSFRSDTACALPVVLASSAGDRALADDRMGFGLGPFSGAHRQSEAQREPPMHSVISIASEIGVKTPFPGFI